MGAGASSGGFWRLSWEGFGSYVGRCWLQAGVFLAILGDVWISWRQDWRTRAQDAADERNSWFFGGLEGGGGDASFERNLGYPPLRNSKGRGWSSHLHLELPTPPGNSTWRLNLETPKTPRTQAVDGNFENRASPTPRDTQHVPKGTWQII